MLVVYEGNLGLSHLAVPKKGCCSNSPVFCVNNCVEESSNSRDIPCCYDADTSNSSLELSHDEVSQDSHHRGFGEAAARGAKSSSFYPISEDTMFLDAPQMMPSISTSSPLSVDSWMMFSNSSSDEYSLSGPFNGTSSNDDTSDFELSSVCKSKANYNCQSLHFEDLELEDEDDEELTPPITRKNITKRLRVKNSAVPKASGSSCRNRSSTPVQVDVRMIDFAHTSFVRKSSSESNTQNGVVHQGPDGGFLQGLDSLKRLLLEILEED